MSESTPEFPQTRGTTPSQPPGSVKSSFAPVKRLAAEHQMKVLCIAIAIIVPCFCLWQVKSIVALAHAPQIAFATDRAGNIHIGPVEAVNPQSALFREMCLSFAQAHFTRNPNGLSLPELAERMYMPDALAKLNAEVLAEAPLFKKTASYQSVEIALIEAVNASSTKLRMRVRGFVQRNGTQAGMAVRNGPYYFSLTYEFVPNPDVGMSGQYPFKVGRYALFWTDSGYNKIDGQPAEQGGAE